MKRLLKDYRLHEHTEALFLLTLGIIIQVLDGSPLDVWDRWTLAWDTEFPREFFGAFTQKIIKTVLSAIIFARCLTSVLYIITGLIVVYCIIKETSPKLMLPWMFISGVKSVLLTFLETLTGVYVCSAFGKVRKPCIEFVASKAVELFFAIYLWACIRSIHKDLELVEENVKEEELLTKMVLHRVNFRKRRARSMIDETTLYKTANLNCFELKDVPNIIFDMLKTEEELSQDSLLSPGMMLASVSNMGSYDCLKTSLSLGELGYIDLDAFQVVGLDDERYLTPSARAMKFLKLTVEDVRRAKERIRDPSFLDNYSPPECIPWTTMEMRPSLPQTKPQRQGDIYVADLPEIKKVKEVMRKKKKSLKLQDDIMSDNYDFDAISEEESRATVEEVIGLDEAEFDEDDESVSPKASGQTDGETTPDLWFMTNRKDEVNRIGLFDPHSGAKRADNYERLYRQEFMNVVGPEVFDKASRLVKLTSLSDVPNAKRFQNQLQSIPSTNFEFEIGSLSEPSDVSEEQIEPVVETKPKKRIVFEDGFGGPNDHTTMPLSIIVTNFPIQLDSQISKCEAVYYQDTVSDSAEIKLVPDSRRGPSLEICDGEVASEMESNRENARILTTKCKNPRQKTRYFPSGSKNSYGLESRKEMKKVNLFLLRYNGGRQSFRYNTSSPRRVSTRSKNSSGALPVLKSDSEVKLPVLRSGYLNGILKENLEKNSRSTSQSSSRLSEQMMFIEDLMRKPIKDVLRSYYRLRELDSRGGRYPTRRIQSNDSVCMVRDTTRQKTPWRLDSSGTELVTPRGDSREITPPATSTCRTVADNETQVCFTEEGLTSFTSIETGVLENPKTNRLSTDGDNSLPSMNLFGNRQLGWSTTPEMTSQQPPRTDQTPKKVVLSHSFPESSPPPVCALPKLSAGSDASCRMVLPPRKVSSHKNEPGNVSLCSAQDTISEIIPLPGPTEANLSICSAESDESFSLFYSKTADLASPLLDMRRFIYPDHIHYSYKNVKKKGFDVELNGGLPLLVRDSLTLNPSVRMKRMETPPDPQTGITRRPMDLTFAYSEAFNGSCSLDDQPGTSFVKEDHQDKCENAEECKIPRLDLPVVAEVSSSGTTRKSKREVIRKKEHKWLKKFGTEDRRSNFAMKKFFDSDLNSSSCQFHSTRGKVGIVRGPVMLLRNGKLNRRTFQKMRLKTMKGNL